MNSQWNFNYGDTKKLAETQRAAMEDINRWVRPLGASPTSQLFRPGEK